MDDAATTVQETEQELLAAVDTAALLQKLKRSNSASRLLGLSVLMDAKADNYFVSPENYVGFKVSQGNISKSTPEFYVFIMFLSNAICYMPLVR